MSENKQLHYYRLSATEVLEQLKTSRDGLQSREAAERLSHNGPNVLSRTKHESAIVTFIRQFKDLLVVMLLVSAAFSLYLKDGKTAAILISIALLNACVGFFQEHKAETLMKGLENLIVPQAKVLRDGKLEELQEIHEGFHGHQAL